MAILGTLDLRACPRTLGVLLVVAVFLGATGCRQEISGKYIGKYPDGICWLEIVGTPDGHVTGQMMTEELGKDATVQQRSIELHGVSDGTNVVLSASSFLQSFNLSGDLRGNRLTLTGAQPSMIVLTRSDIKELEKEQVSLDQRSRQLLAAAEERKFLSQLNQAINRMNEFITYADVHLGRFPGGEEHLRSITQKMEQYVRLERQLVNYPTASVRRTQLSVAANQESIATDQLHLSLQNVEASFQQSAQQITQEVTSLEQVCQKATESESVDKKTACARLRSAYELYRSKFGALAAGLSHVETVYAQEHKAQEELLQVAQQFQ